MIERLLIERKKLGITWDVLAADLPIGTNSLRVAFQRGRVDQVYLNHVEEIINKYKKEKGVKVEITNADEIIVLSSLANKVIENHKKLLNIQVYKLWFEVQVQERIIDALK
jgi:hypothetical protein